MTDQEKLAAIRAELPATTGGVYLNTGTCGPLPRSAVAALRREAETELLHGRIGHADFDRLLEAWDDLRARFARLLSADPAEVALMHHTTDGMNVGTWGLNWRPGDELLINNLEHPGGLLPAYMVGRRLGVTVRVVELGLGGEDVLERLERAMTARTRLISLSHVSYSSGLRMPLAEIAAMAHRRGALVLVDAAQSAGATPLDVTALGVDMVAVPGQKWLCGPEGMGALYVRRDLLSLVKPTFVGFLSLWPDMNMDMTGEFQLASSARRYEVGTMHRPSLFAMRESLRWLEEAVGWDWAFARIERMAERAAGLLTELPGTTILTPASRAGLIHFRIEGHDPDTLVAGLAERNVLIRSVHDTDCLRASTGFFNSEADLLALRDGLAELIGA